MTEFTFITPLASQWARTFQSPRMIATNLKKNWFGFLRIPEARVGRFAIRHRVYPEGSVLPLSTDRTMIFAGHPQVNIVAEKDVTVHELVEFQSSRSKRDPSVWMTDLPIEQAQIDPDLEPMTGRVLVGGLGLGYAAQQLALRDSVSEVVVIERSREVIELVADHLKGSRTKTESKIRVVHADLHAWLRDHGGERFDWAFYDIWAPDGERTFFQHVVPLRWLSRGLVPNEHVRCWNEDVMRGQLRVGLISRLQIMLNPDIFNTNLTVEQMCKPHGRQSVHTASHDFTIPFFKAIRDGKFTLADALERAPTYVDNFGIPGRDVL